jgi:hypothetical protein
MPKGLAGIATVGEPSALSPRAAAADRAPGESGSPEAVMDRG